MTHWDAGRTVATAVLAVVGWMMEGGSHAMGADEPGRVVIARSLGLPCGDCDGIALGDINGNGRLDLLASSGKGGTTYWFEQGDAPWTWARHTIHEITQRPREVEGNELGDFNDDGRLEAISLDQPGGRVLLHRQGADPRQPWPTGAIRRERPLVQASLVADVDGDGRDDLIFTWEGRQPDQGGVHWLKFTGSDLLDPEHWTEYVMIQHPSAWWLAPRRIDINGNGQATDLVFTARNLKHRNPGAQPGVFWLEPPDDVTQPWARHTIDTSLRHPLHVDLGNFSGDGHGQDLVVSGFDTDKITWFRFSNNWEKHELTAPRLPSGATPSQVWNVKSLPLGGTRDAILSPVNRGNEGSLLVFQFRDGVYQPHELRPLDYNHPMDDRILLTDLTGDGRPEALVPDSGPGVNKLWIFQFGFEQD